MIAVFVTFEYAEGFDRKRILKIAENARGTFAGMHELRQKAFTIDDENRRARNVYLWESEEAAQAFFTPQLAERITGFYGVRARIEFAGSLRWSTTRPPAPAGLTRSEAPRWDRAGSPCVPGTGRRRRPPRR